MGDPLFHRDKTDGEGRFRAREMGSIPYAVVATAVRDGRRYRAETEVPVDQDEVTLTLAEATGDEEEATAESAVREAVTGKDDPPRPSPRPARPEPKPPRRVRVLGPDGTPVPRADVLGAYFSPVQDGEWEVSAWEIGDAPVTACVVRARSAEGDPLPWGPARVTLAPDDPRKVVARLPPERVISGIVRSPEGRGIEAALVTATPSAIADEDVYRAMDQSHGSVRTRADGTFRVGRLGEEDYHLTFVLPEGLFASEPVRVRGGAVGLVIDTHPGITARLVIHDGRGRPVAHARASANIRQWRGSRWGPPAKEAIPVAEGVADSEGRVSLSPLDPRRRYELQVEGATLWNVSPRREADGPYHFPLEISEWEPEDGPITLDRIQPLSGSVLDEDGVPVEGATVFLHDHWFLHDREGPPLDTTTDAEGRFTFEDATEGTRTVGVAWNAGADPDPTSPRSQVLTGDPNVVLRLRRGASLAIRLSGLPDWSKEELSRVYAWKDEPGSPLLGRVAAGADGVHRLRGLREGDRYTVWVEPRRGRSAIRTGLAPGPETVSLAVDVEGAIRGHIQGVGTARDIAAGAVHLEARGPRPGMVVEGTVKDNGDYEIVGLVEATWEVEASAGAISRVVGGASGSAHPGEVLNLEWRTR